MKGAATMATAMAAKKRQVEAQAEGAALLLKALRDPAAGQTGTIAGEIVATLREAEARLAAAPAILESLAEADRNLKTMMEQARLAGDDELTDGLQEASATVGKQVAALAEVRRTLKETLTALGGGRIFVCEECGKIGVAKQVNKRFCGATCRSRAFRERGGAEARKKI